MAVDYAVVYRCEPRTYFGRGDWTRGMTDILARLKAGNRAAAVRHFAAEQGQSPDEVKVAVRAPDREGNLGEKDVTLADLEAEARPLDDHGTPCADCPMNLYDQPYGCFGCIHYPIPAASEAWLLGRLQPFGTFGAALCTAFMAESGVTGRSIRGMRRSGFFEATRGASVTLKKGFLKSVSVSADQLLETIMGAGSPLTPGHCFGILLWVGAIKVDGSVPGGSEDQPRIDALLALKTREEKEARTAPELGPPPSDPAQETFRTLVRALYLSWTHDAPVWISV